MNKRMSIFSFLLVGLLSVGMVAADHACDPLDTSIQAGVAGRKFAENRSSSR